MTRSRASGQCHCGAIRYSMPTAVEHHALCHCQEWRPHAGATMGEALNLPPMRSR